MCTVSLIPPHGSRGLRLVINRDERRSRMAAWPPRTCHDAGVALCAPIDPESLGTWVAGTSAGLAWTLTNRHPNGELLPRAAAVSRGRLIPMLGSAPDLSEASARFTQIDLAPFAAFRLLVAGHGGVLLLEWDGRDRSVRREPFVRPLVFASSSLGDALVETPRQHLFGTLVAAERDPWLAQDRFHQHAWPDRRHLSVVMSRPTACTVSLTTITIDDDRVELRYAPMIDGWPGPVAACATAVRVRRASVPA